MRASFLHGVLIVRTVHRCFHYVASVDVSTVCACAYIDRVRLLPAAATCICLPAHMDYCHDVVFLFRSLLCTLWRPGFFIAIRRPVRVSYTFIEEVHLEGRRTLRVWTVATLVLP